MPTATEATFASDAARELADQYPDAQLPAEGSGAGGALTKADVQAAVGTSSSGSSSQPTITQSRPTLSSGSDGPAVVELGLRLAKLGYENSISRGENYFSILDDSVLAAVHAFKRSKSVDEPAEVYGGGERDARNHVGPYTWQALIDATDD